MDLEESPAPEEDAGGAANRGCQVSGSMGAAGRDDGASVPLMRMLLAMPERAGRDMGRKLKPATGSPGWQNEPPLCWNTQQGK